MKRLFIVGASGLGRETLDIARVLEAGAPWRIAGFLDSRADMLRGKQAGFAIVGAPESFSPGADDLLVCAVGAPAHKRRYVEMLAGRGARFTSLLHPECDVSPSARLGTGVVVMRYGRVGPDAVVGDHVSIGYAAGIAHDVQVGRYCHLSGHAAANGRAVLEDEVTLGSHAVVIPDVVVGRGATVGTGSVAIRNVPPGTTVFGLPATRLS
jgi:sugar O-acyltransferase (sialic acid O-acetyltransferase NeuD family)